ncbi:c-type cytochrome [Aquincola tertiaricarbonis]|uniref:C-type cytochrome n=1 Tax=Aquincola tertiaricarbonis TaxID=391953 RepID=A0ABY4SEK1_AQUTE|nr:c-type cytochrome [Aquincola tertiaricarbonis]URI10347.1 c-type cytochrome [Aquincola tertiaricarbonis]
MSDAHKPVINDPHDMPHEGPIKTPKQLVVTVVFSFLIPIFLIVLLATYVAGFNKPGAGTELLAEEAVARRIQPVGTVEIKDLADPAAMKTGEQVFNAQCAACHTTGAAGAPKLGDNAAWAARVSTGYDALLNSALHGKGNMGAQGGGDFTDFEIGRAVVYMANKSGGSLKEPVMAPAGAASGAEAPASAASN